MPKIPSKKLKRISLDTETTGVDLHHGAKPYLVTSCNEEGENTFWEWDVNPETREPIIPSGDLAEIEAEIQSADLLAFQNPKFDLAALRTLTGAYGDEEENLAGWIWEEWPFEIIVDTLLAGHLLASNQPHDLTTMALIYLGVNIQPFEDRVQKATMEARRYAKTKYPMWKLAKAGLPEMPSAKGKEKNKRARGEDKDSVWKYDMWLPRAIAKEEGYDEDHPWWTVTSEYANADSAVTLPLYLRMIELIRERNLEAIYKSRLELIGTIYRMESRRVTISAKRTKKLHAEFTEIAEKAHNVCLNVADNEIDKLPLNGTSNALKYVVFDKFNLKTEKKTKTGMSMDKYVLDEWLVTLKERTKPHTFIKNLRAYRKRMTALGYMKTYEKYQLPTEDEDTYALYPSSNPTGTDTLRFSMANPNGQQVSKQEETNVRYIFGPAPGREWWSLDAKNIELRLPAYEAGETEMIALFEKPKEPPYFGSYHLLVFHTLHPNLWASAYGKTWPWEGKNYGRKIDETLVGDYCKTLYESNWYQWVKNGNFAVQYGAQEASGTADKAYHVPGAQRRIQGRFTKIDTLSKSMIRFAEKYGYVETMPDKTVDPKRGYPLLCTRSKWGGILPTVPLSYHIQGTAMWWMTRAMVRCDRYLEELNRESSEGYFLIMQIHDELLFDFPKLYRPATATAPAWYGNYEKIMTIKKLMEMGGEGIGIPTPVSCKYHLDTWSLGVSV